MRYAVFSDLHSNLEALVAFLDKAKTLKIDEMVCLGDIVGYNASPNECIDLLKKHKVRCVLGNHDARAAGIDSLYDFNPQAAAAIEWTAKSLTEENREFLKSLPRALAVGSHFLAVHGWINDTDQYILGANDALRNFEILKEMSRARVCFFGHTHVGAAYMLADGAVQSTTKDTLQIERNSMYLINPGALGQPRDRDPRASFAVYDTKSRKVRFYRLEYDIAGTSRRILEAGLPERLAERLKLGW